MILSLVWKECREHRTIWVAMALVTCAMLYGARVIPPSESHYFEMIVYGSITLVATYGLVCGSMMCAGEHESGTMTWLDILTGRRTPIWRARGGPS